MLSWIKVLVTEVVGNHLNMTLRNVSSNLIRPKAREVTGNFDSNKRCGGISSLPSVKNLVVATLSVFEKHGVMGNIASTDKCDADW